MREHADTMLTSINFQEDASALSPSGRLLMRLYCQVVLYSISADEIRISCNKVLEAGLFHKGIDELSTMSGDEWSHPETLLHAALLDCGIIPPRRGDALYWLVRERLQGLIAGAIKGYPCVKELRDTIYLPLKLKEPSSSSVRGSILGLNLLFELAYAYEDVPDYMQEADIALERQRVETNLIVEAKAALVILNIEQFRAALP